MWILEGMLIFPKCLGKILFFCCWKQHLEKHTKLPWRYWYIPALKLYPLLYSMLLGRSPSFVSTVPLWQSFYTIVWLPVTGFQYNLRSRTGKFKATEMNILIVCNRLVANQSKKENQKLFLTFVEKIFNFSTCQNFLLPIGYSLDTVLCFWHIDYPMDICLMEYFYCWFKSNCLLFSHITWNCWDINNSIKSLTGELNCSNLLWKKRQSKCFATCLPPTPILKTIFSYFKIYSSGFPCHCLVDNVWHICWKATNTCHCLFQGLCGLIFK